MREEFIDLFVTCLKRLKGEFPELKFGGPALAWVDEPFLRGLLAACKAGGVAPDFVSWHWYGIDPDEPARQAAQMREICRSCGFPDVELILDEWHFLAENNWNAIRGTSEEWLRTHTGPASMTGLDSAAFAMAVEAKLLDADVAQAYYYGCGFDWDWGYFDVLTRRYVKSFYAMQAMGELFAGCTMRLKCASLDRAVTPLAALAADGRSATVLVADYRSGRERIEVAFAGATEWIAATDPERTSLAILLVNTMRTPWTASVDAKGLVARGAPAFRIVSCPGDLVYDHEKPGEPKPWKLEERTGPVPASGPFEITVPPHSFMTFVVPAAPAAEVPEGPEAPEGPG